MENESNNDGEGENEPSEALGFTEGDESEVGEPISEERDGLGEEEMLKALAEAEKEKYDGETSEVSENEGESEINDEGESVPLKEGELEIDEERHRDGDKEGLVEGESEAKRVLERNGELEVERESVTELESDGEILKLPGAVAEDEDDRHREMLDDRMAEWDKLGEWDTDMENDGLPVVDEVRQRVGESEGL